MRRLTAEPTHHPVAWLLLPGGLLLMVSAFTSAEGSLRTVFLALGLGLAADGLAEVLPTRLLGVAAGLRILSLAAFCVAFLAVLIRLFSRLVLAS